MYEIVTFFIYLYTTYALKKKQYCSSGPEAQQGNHLGTLEGLNLEKNKPLGAKFYFGGG